VKLCGMMRPEDVAAAVELGADFVGVIFAGGPRVLTVERARRVLEPARGRVRAVGVFGRADAAEIGAAALAAGIDVVQLHADPLPGDVTAMRAAFGGPVWAAARISGAALGGAAALYDVADAVLLDARVDGALGGTGHTLPWASLRDDVQRQAGRGALTVLAGGLRPENVATAIAAVRPDIVDASSGVEHEVGVKDHARMRAFIAAARRGAAPGDED
ncbi:MAG: phosphoribosylanthranilate isomerase, partial [Gemmatimonadaceae bacterium]|nr:phosphoribosylanthranilate isomerase [Gemmatimonadaceae bacterium]